MSMSYAPHVPGLIPTCGPIWITGAISQRLEEDCSRVQKSPGSCAYSRRNGAHMVLILAHFSPCVTHVVLVLAHCGSVGS